MNILYFIYIWLIIIKFGKLEENMYNNDTYFRLPKIVIPIHYALTINTTLEENNYKHTSSVIIHIRCIKPTNKITLHSRNLKIKQVKLTDINHGQLAQKYELEPEYDFLHVFLKKDLVETDFYDLNIGFTGEIEHGMSGYYRSNYKDESGQTKWIATTHFEPTNARAAFPCFDEPALRTKFTILLGHRPHLTATSNMPLNFTRESKNGWVWDTFQTTLKLPTYLVAFAITDFGHKTTVKSNHYGNTTIHIWTPKKLLQQAEFALKISSRILSFFEEYLDVAYPLPKSDMLAIPDFAGGGMENWGMITFRESQLLYVPGSAAEYDKYFTATTVAHELAHYWFGDLVTIKWWSYLWLKEGFATYLARVAVGALFPEMNEFFLEAIIRNMENVYAVDALESSRQVSIPIDHPNRINEIFDGISYSKGNCIIRMMEHFLGNEVLKKGLTHYLNKYKYDSTEQNDLWNSLTIVAHKNKSLPKKLSVKKIMDSWTLQPGYPLVTVTRNYINGTVNVAQNRFLENMIKHDDSCYWVPLSYTINEKNDFNSTKPKIWLPCPKQNVTFKLNKSNSYSWILFNIEATGLYRVNYDHTNWKMLIYQLESDYTKIGTINRILLIDDVMNLAMTGHVDFITAFDLIRYIRHDDKLITWTKVLEQMLMIGNFLNRTPQYGLLEYFINNLITPIFNQFGGFICNLTEFSKLQVLITKTACSNGNHNCKQVAATMFKKWKQSRGKYTIPEPIRELVYCQGVQMGSEDDWNYLWHEYLKSNITNEKNMILKVLGCTQTQWLLVRYLAKLIKKDSDIRHQDIAWAFKSIVENKVGFYFARLFFYEHVQDIYEIQSPKGNDMRKYLPMIANSIRTEREFKEFTIFLKENEKYFKMAHITKKLMLEKLVIWKQWYKNLYPKVVLVLQQEKSLARYQNSFAPDSHFF